VAAARLPDHAFSKDAITSISPHDVAVELGLVHREFTAARPNQLWGADITYVATWAGFV
jgi:transposase InsO family protein